MVDDVMAIQKCSDKSILIDKTINIFMDMEKLSLSKKNIHIGNKRKQCPRLKVNEHKMNQSKLETYLGDQYFCSISLYFSY